MKHSHQDGKGEAATPSLVRPNSMMDQEGPRCRAISLPANGLLGNPLSLGRVFTQRNLKPRAAASCDRQCPGTCFKSGVESAQLGDLTQSHPLNEKDRKLWSGWAMEEGHRCENHLSLPRQGAMVRQLIVNGKEDVRVHPAGSWPGGKPSLPKIVQGHFVFLLSPPPCATVTNLS